MAELETKTNINLEIKYLPATIAPSAV